MSARGRSSAPLRGSGLTSSSPSRRRIVVVGGGISGLAAAYTLARARQAGAPIEEYLLEGSPRWGGVIRTEKFDGFVIEGGPDSFLTEKPEAAALCRELGLASQLLGSNDRERRTYILHRGRLEPLPDGLYMLVPTRLWPLVRTPLLPARSKLAALAELFRRPSGDRADESAASFVGRHFGPAMVQNIADPLLAGVYGGDSENLSAPAVLPRFWRIEKETGSLTRGVLRARRAHRREAASAPLFTTLDGGLEELVRALVERLEPSRLLLGQKVEVLETGARQPKGRPRWVVRVSEGAAIEADAVVLALPAYESARLLARADPVLAQRLGEIPYSSAVTVAFGFESKDVKLAPGHGLLVPRQERRRLLAVTFVHAKFPRRAPSGKLLLRCFLGGTRDPEIIGASDAEIVGWAREELAAILGLGAEPLFCRLTRSPQAMAQYTVGHLERLRAIEARVEELPGLTLSGNAYSGIGISDCIRTGQAAAARALSV